MTRQMEIYKCEICGNIVELLHAGGGELVCCGQPMTLREENSVDAAKEKHVPVIEKTTDGYLVKVGSVEHPMDNKHHIEWIELVGGSKVLRHNLTTGDSPEANFCIDASQVSARAYCNLHGLWRS